ncbi:MAG: hypothetical protein V4436_00725 [Patescibacteria group bacterium]
MKEFELGTVPSNLRGLFFMLRERVTSGDFGKNAAWEHALKQLLLMKDPEEAKKLLEQSERDSSLQFPLYLMLVDKKPKFLPLQEAGVTFDSGWVEVDTGGFVLEADLSVRPMTREEERKISDIADEYSARK